MEISKVTTSIIVLTKNSVSTIDKCLQSIFAQTKKPQEVLVIDGNSTDGTLEIVKKYPVKLSSEPGLGYGHARNLGVKNALSETIAFVDSDCILDKEYLSELLTTLLSSELTIGGVGGIVFPIKKTLVSESFNVRLFGISSSSESKVREVESISGGTCLYRKELLLKIGGFNENICGAEDYEINQRIRKAGYKLFIVPSAKSLHLHPTTLKKLAIKWFSYGKFLLDMSSKTSFKKDVIISWVWSLTCIAAIIALTMNITILKFLIFIMLFFLPWAIYYGKQTISFWRNNFSVKYLLFPIIHQIMIISRTAGILYSSILYPFKKKNMSSC